MVGERDKVSTERGNWFAGLVGLVVGVVPVLATLWPAWWQDLDAWLRLALFIGWGLAALVALYCGIVQARLSDDPDHTLSPRAGSLGQLRERKRSAAVGFMLESMLAHNCSGTPRDASARALPGDRQSTRPAVPHSRASRCPRLTSRRDDRSRRRAGSRREPPEPHRAESSPRRSCRPPWSLRRGRDRGAVRRSSG